MFWVAGMKGSSEDRPHLRTDGLRKPCPRRPIVDEELSGVAVAALDHRSVSKPTRLAGLHPSTAIVQLRELSMQDRAVFVGVDVAKAKVAVAAHLESICAGSVENNGPSLQRWLDGLPKQAVLGMESTGAYHSLLAQLAHARGLKVYVLNARDIYFYARALGTRGKSDRVDARVIARYLAEQHARLHAWQPGSAAQREVDELLRRRARVVKYQGALRQTLEGCVSLSEAARTLQVQLKTFLQVIDTRIQHVLQSDAKLEQDCRRLRTITGIGPQGSAMLTALFNRLAFTRGDAVVAYSGMDPRPCDSGTKRGRRRLTKRGPAELRRQVYLIGLAASHSKLLKPLYQGLRARGLASTEAIVVLGRKLLRVAFAVWKRGDVFDPSRLLSKGA